MDLNSIKVTRLNSGRVAVYYNKEKIISEVSTPKASLLLSKKFGNKIEIVPNGKKGFEIIEREFKPVKYNATLLWAAKVHQMDEDFVKGYSYIVREKIMSKEMERNYNNAIAFFKSGEYGAITKAITPEHREWDWVSHVSAMKQMVEKKYKMKGEN